MTFLTEDARRTIEELFQRHAAGMGRYVRLRVGSAELAEEITARVFLTVVRNFHQQRGSLLGWLWAILRSELGRHYREKPHREVPPDLPATAALPADELERKERDALLHSALTRLSAADQELISLKFFLELSNLEIAEALAVTPSNVGVKVHRALKELRGLLEKPLSMEPVISYRYE